MIPPLSFLADHPEEAEPYYDALGRPSYIAADQAKELLPAWREKSKRASLEEQEHQAASRLAYKLFHIKLSRLRRGANVTLVTGPVAAGKTTFVKDAEGLVYEVNLSDPAKAEEHVDRILSAGLIPHIVYVHVTPEISAVRRAMRASQDGRPVRIDRSTSQHLQLPAAIAHLARKYASALDVRVFDNSCTPPRKVPTSRIASLRYNGTEDELLATQQNQLDLLLLCGAIGKELFDALSRRAK